MDLQLGLFPDEPTPGSPNGVDPAPVGADVAAIAGRLPAAVRLGASSWSFPGWEGLVYDRGASPTTLARHGLRAYASHPLLRTVGVDRTYYRSITAADFRAYSDAVPDDFRVLVKADRLLTSPIDPQAFGVRSPNPHFLDADYAVEQVVRPMLDGLGERAGPLLFQFPPIPPNLVGGARAFVERLRAFIQALPMGPLYAIELRSPAFLDESYARLLEATGVAHCYSVHPAMTPLARQLEMVSPFYQPALIVRWMLHSGLRYEEAKERYEPFDRIVDDDPESRGRIALAVLDALVAERPAFVIASNKAEGSAPLSLVRLASRIVDEASGPRSRAEPSGRDGDAP